MKVRRYTDSDLQSVVHVFTKAVHELTADHYDVGQRAAWAPAAPDLAAWRERLDKLDVLVAEDEDGSLLGFIAHEANGHVDLLFTAPEHARKGVATLLYQGAEAELAASGVVTIDTAASVTARPFFEEQGFHVTGEEEVERGGAKLPRVTMRKVRGGVG